MYPKRPVLINLKIVLQAYSQDMEVVLVAMSSHYHPQQLLSIKKSVGTRRLFKIVKVPQSIFLDLGARVLNLKEVYLSHLLVFLNYSKDILQIGRAHV